LAIGRRNATVRRVDGSLALDALGSAQLHRFRRVVAGVADGGEIALPVNVLAGRALRPRLVVVAAVHGDEQEGPAALVELCDELDPAELQGTLVVVPVANPPAFRLASRWNRADGVDMNRIFPADPKRSITHLLAHVLVEEVVRGADALLTIHGWTQGSLTVPYVEYTGDHRTTQAGRELAAAFGARFLEPLGLLPGRLLSHASRLGIPACEAEVGGEGISLPDRRHVARDGVRGVMQHLGLLPGEPARPPGQRDVTRSEVHAPVGGMLRRTDELGVGQAVQGGRPLAVISNLNGESLVELRVPSDGVLAMLRHSLSVEPGDLVAAVFH
jgi:predicted deacylase